MASTVRDIGTDASISISKKKKLDARGLPKIDKHKFSNELNIHAIFISTNWSKNKKKKILNITNIIHLVK